MPKIKLLNSGKPNPVYLSNGEFADVQKAVSRLKFIDPKERSHFQRAFHFYRETGCRLSEPFYGVVNGNFLTIEAENAKTHQTRDVFLTPELLRILCKMRDCFDRYKGKNKEDYIKRYSRIFKKALRLAKVQGKKFHCLRHTFAVRRYLQTREIYQVAKQLGHSSVATTEIYAKFSFRWLEQDFPDLARGYHRLENVPQNGVTDTDLTDTGLIVSAVSRRKVS